MRQIAAHAHTAAAAATPPIVPASHHAETVGGCEEEPRVACVRAEAAERAGLGWAFLRVIRLLMSAPESTWRHFLMLIRSDQDDAITLSKAANMMYGFVRICWLSELHPRGARIVEDGKLGLSI
jgi:hypothetical protein